MRLQAPKRLTWKLLAAILPPVAGAIAVIVWLQYNAAKREMLGSIDREMGLLALRTAAEVDELLDQRYRDLFTLSETPLIADYYHNVDFQLTNEAETYRKELERYLGRFAGRSRDYAQVLYLDARGRTVCRVTAQPGAPSPGLPAEDFAQAAKLKAGEWWASSVEDLPGAGPVVYFAKPVRDDQGALKGMLALAYDLSRLRVMLAQIAVGKHGGSYIETARGRRIEGRAAVPAEERIVATGAVTRRPWTVVVEAPLDDFLGPLRSVKNKAIATSLLGLALLVGILLGLVRSLTRPIAALAAAAGRIGEGHLSARVSAVGEDELGALSGAFNTMAERLQADRKANTELQSQLIQAEKLSAVGQLISAVAHELNNPLGAIFGYAQILLQEQKDGPSSLRADLEHIHKSVLRCQKVVQNLLFFVRKSGQERKKIDLNEAMDSAVELLAYRLRKTGDVKVVAQPDPTAPKVMGDMQQVVQVLVNLIGNACDAMEGVRRPEGNRLVIRVRGRPGWGTIEVEDNGPGIAPDVAAKIFEPFFTTKPAGRGTGLGLPICKQIAAAHGGDVAVESVPGKGTIFRVDLPAADAAALESEAEPESAPPLPPVPGRRVLVADDEKEIADLIARLMREDGDEVSVAYHGGEALKLLKGGRYDLVITDMEMEQAKGSDLFAALRGANGHPASPMLFVTGDLLNPKVLKFLQDSGCPFLAKPFEIAELLQAARRLLAGSATGTAGPARA